MIYSIGHSTLPASEFANLATLSSVSTIIDIRSHPTSRWEQFRKESMEEWLPKAGITYEWWPELGGWDKRHAFLSSEMAAHGVDVDCYVKGKFPKQRIAINKEPDCRQEFLPIVRPSWTNVGLRDFSWFMSLPEFMEGADRLLERGARENVAIMCCELLWWKCHRSMVADYMVWLGEEIVHLQPKRTLHSQAIGNRLARYETEIESTWNKWVTIP